MTRWDKTPASRILAGDLGAIAARYRSPLVGFLQGVHRLQRADAEEVVAEAFARMTRHGLLARYDPRRGAFHNYLLGIVRHALQAHREGERRKPAELDALEDFDVEAAHETTDRRFDTVVRERFLDLAIRRLAEAHPDDARLLADHHGGGRPLADLRRPGESASAARKRHERALGRLREAFLAVLQEHGARGTTSARQFATLVERLRRGARP